jgi:hypothetical protein
MVEPLSVAESLSVTNLNTTNNKIAILIGIDKYDKVKTQDFGDKSGGRPRE